jgi:hypothetical protein
MFTSISDIPANSNLYLYGSGARHLDSARDVDLVCISPELAHAECKSGKRNFDQLIKNGNIYLVPEAMFLQDCCKLIHGGYYAHKFALSFRSVKQEPRLVDYAALYWQTEFQSIRAAHLPTTTEFLVRAVHYRILHFNPTFSRSLKRYLESAEALPALIRDVEYLLSKPLQAISYPSHSEWAQTLYRFWREYHSFKDSGEFPGFNTQRKFTRSMAEAHFDETNGYFNMLAADNRATLASLV